MPACLKSSLEQAQDFGKRPVSNIFTKFFKSLLIKSVKIYTQETSKNHLSTKKKQESKITVSSRTLPCCYDTVKYE